MSKEKGRIIVITGNGKGKTTSSLGTVIRALGWGYKVLLVQFIKGSKETGEMLFLKNIKENFTLLSAPCPFSWETKDKEADKRMCTNTFFKAIDLAKNKKFDLIVLDEINVAIDLGYIDESIVLDFISKKTPEESIILTGRNASEKLINLADTVSEVKVIKHIFDSEKVLTKGIEY